MPMHKPLQFLVLALSLSAGLGCSASSPESDINAAIEEGLSLRYAQLFPIGRFVVMSNLDASMRSMDAGDSILCRQYDKKYSPDCLERLMEYQKHGLLALREMPQSTLESIAQMGARVFESTPSTALRDMRDSVNSTADFLVVRSTHEVITSVIRDTPYDGAGPATDMRLIMGISESTPTPLTKTLGFNVNSQRFRALVKFDPFTKRYAFVTADVGPAEHDVWSSTNVK